MDVINLNGVEYIKRDSVKDMENELKALKSVIGQISELSNNIPMNTVTRHTIINGNDDDVYQVPPSGQEIWNIRFMNDDGEFFTTNNRQLKITIKEVFVAQKELSRYTTVAEARDLRKSLNLNEYLFSRLIWNLQQGVFTKFIQQWNKFTQPRLGKKAIEVQNNPEKRKESMGI